MGNQMRFLSAGAWPSFENLILDASWSAREAMMSFLEWRTAPPAGPAPMCVRRARSARGKAHYKPLPFGSGWGGGRSRPREAADSHPLRLASQLARSEEHTSELQSLMRNSYAVFRLKHIN